MATKLRWLAVNPSVVAAWWVALIAGMAAWCAAERLRPPDKLISGWCDVPWWGDLERGISIFGATLAAVLVVTVSTWVAPSHKANVAWLSFGVGAVIAVVIGFLFVWELVAAILAGAVAAAILARRLQRGA